MRLPNFVIAGVPKAGTSSLHAWLADHPRAAGSIEKETFFFADPGTHMYRGSTGAGMDAYARCFPAAAFGEVDVLFESTPSYVYYQEALLRLPSLPTRPKCLFILREPSAQIYSLYQYFRNNWSWVPYGMSFQAFVEAVRQQSHSFGGNELARNALRNACYVDFLERWRDALGADRMQVRAFEELVADEVGFTKSVAGWLGLDPSFYDRYGFPRANETYTVRSSTLQKLNVRLRAGLPKGRVYSALRRGYRRLNTLSPRAPGAEDLQVMRALQEEFRRPNEHLSKAFDLDLSKWRLRAGA